MSNPPPMSAQDIWQLKVPIRLTLAQDEISSPGDVKPVYLLAPRFAYLPALAQQCLSCFQHLLLQMPGQEKDKFAPWFEYEGLALSWTQPLGVLHDLLTPHATNWPAQQQQQQQQQQQHCSAAFSTSAIPWCLTVHFRNQPASLVSSWQNSGTAQDHFLSSLKEAGYCCRGTDGCNAVMRLTVQDELWAAVNRGDGALVRQHLTPLRLTPTQRQGSLVPTVPVRLFIRQHKADSSAGLMGVWSDVYSTNRAVEMQQPDASATLLAHLVHQVMPQRFPALQQRQGVVRAAASSRPHGAAQQEQALQTVGPAARAAAADSADLAHKQDPMQGVQPEVASDPLGGLNSTCSQPAAAGGAGGDEQTGSSGAGEEAADDAAAAAAAVSGNSRPDTQPSQPQAELSVPSAASAAPDSSQAGGDFVLRASWPAACAVYVCGVQPDWHTPLGWLHAHFQAADGFLYVVVHLPL